jgi:hypothetical protein
VQAAVDVKANPALVGDNGPEVLGDDRASLHLLIALHVRREAGSTDAEAVTAPSAKKCLCDKTRVVAAHCIVRQAARLNWHALAIVTECDRHLFGKAVTGPVFSVAQVLGKVAKSPFQGRRAPT